ncbi:hypothetical protein [Acidocella sp.]|uniref:hypothetical protein n=1 Tax=Acidocella sp. TaxID=50710 RepID=UPI002D7F8DAE|nr:hypothetical protein [Acidocella sp.]
MTEIETGHVTKILEPISTTKPETASRVRVHQDGAELRHDAWITNHLKAAPHLLTNKEGNSI